MQRKGFRDGKAIAIGTEAALLLVSVSCNLGTARSAAPPVIDRLASIPPAAVKMTPATDNNPVVSYSSEFTQPVPVPGDINTAGAEDSPLILPDGNTMYFFFSPDMNVPVEQQVLNPVIGIYVAQKAGGVWDAGSRVVLANPGTLALDGCEFVLGDTMWFCSAREGWSGMHWFTAFWRDGAWRNWTIADFDPAYRVGELHMTMDGQGMYYHSARPGGKGGLDIWYSAKSGGRWGEPVDVEAVNSESDDGWPALSPDETELWILRDYALWRSKLVDSAWQTPEKIFGPLAGEATLDSEGNVYFVHHYYQADRGIEADIYVSHRVS